MVLQDVTDVTPSAPRPALQNCGAGLFRSSDVEVHRPRNESDDAANGPEGDLRLVIHIRI